jgi:ABC-type transport system substrate-binding protein
MNRFLRPIQAALVLMILAALSSCTLGQVVNPPSPTVDIGAVKTAAAATALVELTKIAGQASPTAVPTKTPTLAPATQTPDATQAANATQNPATATVGGLPASETPVVAPMAGTPGSVIPSLTPLVPPASTDPTCLNSKYVADVTIPDGTVMQPGEKFTKIWRIQNAGTCSWDQGFGFIRWAGPSMNSKDIYYSIRDQAVGAGGIVDFAIEMRAPYEAGEYVAHWVMISDTGKTFGGDFTVFIKVVK